MEAVRPVLEAIFSYLKDHPEELLRALRNALALRFGLPIDALRWLAGRARGKRAPRQVEIATVPPGVRVGASFDLMNTPLRASADIFIERVEIDAERLLFEIRLANVKLKVEDETSESPLAALLRSGALDLSRPGNLVHYMPKRPPLLVEARDDRIVIDLFRHKKFAENSKLRRWISRVVPLVTVTAIESDEGHLDVALAAFPRGLGNALEDVRRATEAVFKTS
jgi:hypothetical protein